jgi:hypothetical protein
MWVPEEVDMKLVSAAHILLVEPLEVGIVAEEAWLELQQLADPKDLVGD